MARSAPFTAAAVSAIRRMVRAKGISSSSAMATSPDDTTL
jgi:hypothetical protein